MKRVEGGGETVFFSGWWGVFFLGQKTLNPRWSFPVLLDRKIIGSESFGGS